VHDAKAMQYIIDVMGEDKICLGSDYPFPLGEQHPGKLIEEMAFTGLLKKKLLAGNAQDWLNLRS
ncbi:MAG TPA: amidohydrolase family protein, partial [Ferruginibacter sp.]|nr:amidohydrolase family protein [Ferruginibacter sp.]